MIFTTGTIILEGDRERLRAAVRAEIVLIQQMTTVDILGHPIGVVRSGGSIVDHALKVCLTFGRLVKFNLISITTKAAAYAGEERELVIATIRAAINDPLMFWVVMIGWNIVGIPARIVVFHNSLLIFGISSLIGSWQNYKLSKADRINGELVFPRSADNEGNALRMMEMFFDLRIERNPDNPILIGVNCGRCTDLTMLDFIEEVFFVKDDAERRVALFGKMNGEDGAAVEVMTTGLATAMMPTGAWLVCHLADVVRMVVNRPTDMMMIVDIMMNGRLRRLDLLIETRERHICCGAIRHIHTHRSGSRLNGATSQMLMRLFVDSVAHYLPSFFLARLFGSTLGISTLSLPKRVWVAH
jgi:hypothetical protein